MRGRLLAIVLVFSLFIAIPITPEASSQIYERKVSYTWEFGAEEYTVYIHLGEKKGVMWDDNTIQLYVPGSQYEYYRALPGGFRIASNYSYFGYFATPGDPYLRELAFALHNISLLRGFDNLTEANFILSFVQEVPYVDDYTSTGFVDYYKFPLETLMDGGDCEDKSILLHTLLDILGYRAVLFVMEVHYMGIEGHVAVGLNITNSASPFSRFLKDYYVYGGRRYYYMESTGSTSVAMGIGGVRTIHYWVGVSPEEAGIDIENLTVVPVSSWHYRGYAPPSGFVEEVQVESEEFPWYLLLLSVFTLLFVPLFILACLREKKRCPRCGYAVEDNYEYCPNCGHWLRYTKPPPPPPPLP